MTEIVKTADGSHTIYVPEIDEHYHSIHGAISESEHIFIKNGLNHSNADPVRIFEVGFGTGLNALLTCIHASAERKKVCYTSIEKYPLSENIVRSLNYPGLTGSAGRQWFEQIHSCKWNNPSEINEYFILHKIHGDITSEMMEGLYDIIYFDAFGPLKQPEMWAPDIFSKISGITVSGGILVTYSVKGDVKRALRSNGFIVSLIPGPRGKRHILRAVKI